MKKIKLLTSLGALSALGSGVAITATSCSNANGNLDSKLSISLDYTDADVIAATEETIWKIRTSYDNSPVELKKLEATSSDSNVVSVEEVDEENRTVTIKGVSDGSAVITVKVTDINGHYNEAKFNMYIGGDVVTESDNYFGTIYGRFKINYEMTQLDINDLVPNYNKNIVIADVVMSPEWLLELHIAKIKDNATIALPSGFLKGCTNLKRLNLSGIKTTSIQSTYLAKPVIGEFSVNRLQELSVPEIVADESGKIELGDFMNTQFGMPSLKKVDLTGFKNLKAIKGWSFLNLCSAIEEIDLSPMKNLEEIGVAFMWGCSGLKKVKMDGLEKLVIIRNGFMENCTSLKEVDMTNLKELCIIGGHFLNNCTSLTTFKFPGDSTNKSILQSIGYDSESTDTVNGYFLANCTSLTSINFSSLNEGKFSGGQTNSIAKFAGKVTDNVKNLIYSRSYGDSDKPSYFLTGCEKLTYVDFGTLDSTRFSTSMNDGTAFSIKVFATQSEAQTFLNSWSGIQYKENPQGGYQALVSGNGSFGTDSVTFPKQIGDNWFVRKWVAAS